MHWWINVYEAGLQKQDEQFLLASGLPNYNGQGTVLVQPCTDSSVYYYLFKKAGIITGGIYPPTTQEKWKPPGTHRFPTLVVQSNANFTIKSEYLKDFSALETG